MKITKEKVRIGIVGHGFVGKAMDWGFNKNVKKFIVDPKINTSISDLLEFDPEYIFICVPTPMEDDGNQDASIITEVLEELIKKCPNSIKVIKSTVLPSILEKIKKIDAQVLYNPEFLREKHANEDFINSSMIILGGDRKLCKKVSELYKQHSRCLTNDHLFTDIETASLIKYSINTFLATKVIFFNEMHEILNKMGTNDSWDYVQNIIARDDRIGLSHMDVPGHDGKLGFGGACFPKDCMAFLKYSNDLGSKASILKAVIKKNNNIRSKYKDLESRESEQNINFEVKI